MKPYPGSPKIHTASDPVVVCRDAITVMLSFPILSSINEHCVAGRLVVSRSDIRRKWLVSIIYKVSILSRIARVNSWVVASPPMSRVRYLLCDC
jgi:hypothetical protein